jgi:hypothetical protein
VVVASNLRGSQDFGRALSEALKQQPVGVDDALFVYYSGHGVQLDGRDFLLGTGAPAAARVADEVRPFAQSAEDFVYEMERALAGTRVLVIDACRNSVFSAARSVGGTAPKGGFALRQDVPNTFVMFANGPGLPTPARSDWGLMGPFTESLTQALDSNSSGDVLELYDRAAKMTRELSPSQDPVLYHTKHIERLVLKPKEPVSPDTRARELLNDARALYARREWTRFQAAVGRGKLIASAAVLKERLSREAEFAALALAAEAAQQSDGRDWGRAAENWEKASRLFPARQWVTMNAALAALYADDIERAARVLAVLSAQSDSDQARQAQKMLAELLKAFPELGPQATKAAAATAKVSGEEFEIVK